MSTAVRAKLRQQSGRMGNVFDLGSYFALGNQVLNKDLSLRDVNFELPSQYGSSGVPAYRGFALKTVQYSNLIFSPLLLSGSVSNALGSINGGTDSASAAFVNNGAHFEQFDTFLDSTLGVTAGKRIVFCAQSAALTMSVIGGFVEDDGSVTWPAATPVAVTTVDYRCVVLAETVGYVYLYCHSQFNSADDGSVRTRWVGIVVYDKSANYGSMLNTNSWQACPRFVCKTDDGKIWFWNQVSSTANTQHMAVLDTATNVLYTSATDAALPSQNGLHKASSGTLCANDPTKYKFYYAIDPGTVNGNITIGARYITKAGSTVAASFAQPTKNACTITGGTIPGMYTATVGMSAAGEVDLWLFNDNGNEYLAVYSHANQDVTSVYSSSNKCPVTKHVLTVLKVDPTNPLNLQYMGSVSDNGFGTGQIFPMFTKSVDGKTVIVGNSGGFSILRFNPATENFVYGSFLSMAITRMCMDKQSQLWVEDDSRNIFIFSPTASTNVVVGFDVDSIAYNGSPVNCNVKVGSFDLYGNRISTSVSLKLSGALFTANSSTDITVTTSASADVLVPISITSAAAVSVSSL